MCWIGVRKVTFPPVDLGFVLPERTGYFQHGAMLAGFLHGVEVTASFWLRSLRVH